MRNKKSAFLLLLISGTILFNSCQKELKAVSTDSTTGTGTASAADLVNDSALSIAKDIYLWYKQIPDTFNARAYGDPSGVMVAIRKYSMETGFTDPVDRYSFGIKKTDWDNLSTGIEQDFGMSVFFNDVTDLRVKYAEIAGPAGLAGIQRGWQVTAINGSTAIDTSAASITMITNAVFSSTSTSFTFKKPDGTSVDITLNAATYTSHPVFADSVYTLSNSTVGYMVFNSFLGNTDDITNDFARVFNRFQQANVSDVIIDLRYNGGGYVSVMEQMANYLVPNAGNGQTMYTTTYNDKYTSQNTTTKFSKTGTINLSRIFFIVSDNTASASELLINNLKPYMTEQLIGPSTHTYGKPVGFFNIPVGDWYVFPISFKTVNKDGNGNYFNGLTIDKPKADGVDKNWGDTQESCLNSVLTYIQTGSYGRTQTDLRQDKIIYGNSKFSAKTFKGAVGVNKLR